MLRRLKEAFSKNLGLKALALVFSVVFFGYIHGQEQTIRKTLPTSLTSIPPKDGSMQLMTQIPASVRITITGSARKMDRLLSTGLSPAEVDLEGYPKNITFEPKMFSLPEGLELSLVDPPRLTLEWEPIILRQIRLQASISGQPADGFVVKGSPKVEPRGVTVRGPVSKVEVMQFARLAPFEVTDLAANTWSRRVAIDPPPAGVNLVGDPAATVSVEIRRRTIERVFRDRPVEVVGSVKARVVPQRVDITVLGDPNIVKALRPEQVIAQANLADSEEWGEEPPRHGSTMLPVIVHLGKVTVESQPPIVTVKW